MSTTPTTRKSLVTPLRPEDHTHQYLTLVRPVRLWDPSDALIRSKPHPLPERLLGRTPKQMRDRRGLGRAVDRGELDARRHECVARLCGERSTGKSLRGKTRRVRRSRAHIERGRTTYSSLLSTSMTSGETPHSSRNAGTTMRAVALVRCTTSSALCTFGTTGARVGSW